MVNDGATDDSVREPEAFPGEFPDVSTGAAIAAASHLLWFYAVTAAAARVPTLELQEAFAVVAGRHAAVLAGIDPQVYPHSKRTYLSIVEKYHTEIASEQYPETIVKIYIGDLISPQFHAPSREVNHTTQLDLIKQELLSLVKNDKPLQQRLSLYLRRFRSETIVAAQQLYSESLPDLDDESDANLGLANKIATIVARIEHDFAERTEAFTSLSQ